MLRRRLPLCTAAIVLTALACLSDARATTAVLPSGTAIPLDQRVAVAVSPSRTTVWTNLRLDTAGTSVGLVVPVPPGAALDHSSDAWFEALDEATAARVFPPSNTGWVCPDAVQDPTLLPLHNTALGEAMKSLDPLEAQVLLDVPAVLAWANTHGFSISPEIRAALENMSGMRFFVERFQPQATPFYSSTLRIVLPSSTPVLPLALTQASTTDLRITAWFIGTGRAALTGSSPLKLQMTDVQWLAYPHTSNYVEVRDGALLTGGSAANVTETASHDALVRNTPVAGGKASITGVVTSYFQRTAAYADGDANPSNCILNAGVALDSTVDVAQACPRATLGVVDGPATCTESPTGSEVDPAKLRCGAGADDLAMALSELRPASTWLTRMTLIVPQQMGGQSWPVTFTSVAPQVDPSFTTSSISYSGCAGTSSSGSTSSGWMPPDPTTTSTGSGFPTTVGNGSEGNPTYEPDYDTDTSCGCGGPAAGPLIIDETSYGGNGGYGGGGGAGGTGGDIYYEDTSSEDCSGDTTESTSTDPYADTSSSEDCSGDTTESTSTETYSDTSSSDDCDGSTTDSSSSSSSDDGIDCSGETGGSSGSGGSTDYFESSSSSSSSSESGDCTVARHPRAKPHKRGPKASVITLGLLAILAPLRRLGRPRRKTRDQKEKLVFKPTG